MFNVLGLRHVLYIHYNLLFWTCERGMHYAYRFNLVQSQSQEIHSVIITFDKYNLKYIFNIRSFVHFSYDISLQLFKGTFSQ